MLKVMEKVPVLELQLLLAAWLEEVVEVAVVVRQKG